MESLKAKHIKASIIQGKRKIGLFRFMLDAMLGRNLFVYVSENSEFEESLSWKTVQEKIKANGGNVLHNKDIKINDD